MIIDVGLVTSFTGNFKVEREGLERISYFPPLLNITCVIAGTLISYTVYPMGRFNVELLEGATSQIPAELNVVDAVCGES